MVTQLQITQNSITFNVNCFDMILTSEKNMLVTDIPQDPNSSSTPVSKYLDLNKTRIVFKFQGFVDSTNIGTTLQDSINIIANTGDLTVFSFRGVDFLSGGKKFKCTKFVIQDLPELGMDSETSFRFKCNIEIAYGSSLTS